MGHVNTKKGKRAEPADTGVEVLTEGQRQLLELPLSGADLAAQLGCSRQAVSCFRSGEKKPGPAIRAKLAELHQIPDACWYESPVDQSDDDPPPSPAPAEPAAPVSLAFPAGERDELREVEALINETRAARASGKLLPRDKDANIRTEADLMKHRRAILERDERLKAFEGLLQHQVVLTILETLRRAHPSAEADVLAALRALKRTV